MAARSSESLVLKTYPFGEADLIVSYFTRDLGKLRGVAKRARKPKSNFGAGLERLSLVRMVYNQPENRELTTLTSCELARSSFPLLANWETAVGLDYLAEVSEELLPPGEVNDKFFRLLLAVLDYLHGNIGEPAAVWPAVLYFNLWAVRLQGFFPELQVTPESAAIAQEMFEKPIRNLTARQWTKSTAGDLRQILRLTIEEQIEKRLLSGPMLERL